MDNTLSQRVAEECFVAPPLVLFLSWENNQISSSHVRLIDDPMHASTEKPVERIFTPEGMVLNQALQAYAHGLPTVWPTLPLAWESLRSPFRARVLHCLLQYAAYGRLLTYGQLAELAGRPGAARAVGSAMHHNPWGLLVPCHRVIGSDHTLHGYAGGLHTKAVLLRIEGWPLEGNGAKTKILPKNFSP